MILIAGNFDGHNIDISHCDFLISFSKQTLVSPWRPDHEGEIWNSIYIIVLGHRVFMHYSVKRLFNFYIKNYLLLLKTLL